MGYLQFGVLGGNENARGIYGAMFDENTIMFKTSICRRSSLYETTCSYESGIAIGRLHPKSPLSMSLTQLRKFASLRDDGIISEEDFQEQKRKLLAGRNPCS